jgi:hypothetical protein
MDSLLKVVDYLKEFFTFLDITQPAAAYGAIFGLIGFALQLILRGEWPTGRLNDGSPKVLDPAAAAWSLVAAMAVGMAAAKFFHLDVTISEYPAAAPAYVKDALKKCTEELKDATKCTPQVQGPAAKAIILIALAYLAADSKVVVDKLTQLFQSIGGLFASIPRKLPGAR